VTAKVIELAEADWAAAEKEAQNKFDTGDPAVALDNVKTWEEFTRSNAGGLPDVVALADKALGWVEDKRAIRETELRAQLVQDRVLYIDTDRSIRHLGDGETAGNPVFDFHFGVAADAFEDKAAAVKTYLYQERCASRVAFLRQLDLDWAAFIAMLPELYGSKDYLKGIAGTPTRARVTLNDKKPLSTESFWVKVALTGGFSSREFRWSSLTPAQFGDIFVRPKLAGVDGAMALGLARIFSEFGEGALAEECLNRAVSAGAEFTPDVETMLRREIAAIREYEKMLAGSERSPPTEAVRVVEGWRARHFSTSFFVLQDGRPAGEIPALTSQEDRDAFFENFGKRR
jgi:hypothetical protein